MRYTAILALTASLALLGCKNLQPGPSGGASAQPAASQSSTPVQGAPGADGANTAPTPLQPQTAATAQPESEPAQPPVKDASKSAPQATKGSASQTPQPPKAANGNSMPPTQRNSGNPPSGVTSAAAGPKGAPQPPPANSAPRVAEPAGAPAVPALDLNSLKERLKDTRAIGVFTKLSLKNQVDDLLSQLRAFHSKKAATSLAELHQRYDLLLLKVLSLLQDGDPSLAIAISQSRDSIWSILSDPQQFAKL